MISDEEIGRGLKILNAIWLAMLASLALYMIVALQVQEQVKTEMDAETFAVLRSVLYTIALATLLLTRYVWKRVLNAKKGQEQAHRKSLYTPLNPALQRYSSAMTVALAMSESIGIFGFILFLLGKNAIDLNLLIIASAAAMCMYRPKREEIVEMLRDNPEVTGGGPQL
jgi:glycopeptide antibiotics resistance protein